MTQEIKDHFISTYGRIALSEWKVLAELIAKHTRLVKKTISQEMPIEESFKILSENQIEDALSGPYQAFFKQKMTAYATIARIQLELSVEKEDLFKEKRQIAPEKKLPKHLVEKYTLAELNNIRNSLDELTLQHNQQWEELVAIWKGQILSQLDEVGMALSDIEIKEFKDEEPWSELADRFTNLHIDFPKTKKTSMTFQNYFIYKADLAIHSALSRQHKPHQKEDIQRVLKQLHSIFNSIGKQEKLLIAEQETATEEIVKSLAFAKK